MDKIKKTCANCYFAKGVDDSNIKVVCTNPKSAVVDAKLNVNSVCKLHIYKTERKTHKSLVCGM